MSVCEFCKQEMLTADGCSMKVFIISGKPYPRIKDGEEGDFDVTEDDAYRCDDCNALKGHYHHFGCDHERCPSCGRQLITCKCRLQEGRE